MLAQAPVFKAIEEKRRLLREDHGKKVTAMIIVYLINSNEEDFELIVKGKITPPLSDLLLILYNFLSNSKIAVFAQNSVRS